MKKKMVLLVICAVLIMLQPLSVVASSYGEETVVPQDAIYCHYCGSISAYEVCLGDAVVAETDTHSYSGGTCTISRYDCLAGIYCMACTRTYRYSWRHPCYILHRGCGVAKHTMCYIANGPFNP